MKHYLILLNILLISFHTNAQQVICLSEKEFFIPDLARKAGISASFDVKMDIINNIPHNIVLIGLDSDSRSLTEMFRTVTERNVFSFRFLKDTINYHLKLKYIIRSGFEINHDFAEKMNNDEVQLVFKKPIFLTQDESIKYFTSDADTLVFDSLIDVETLFEKKSDILVERIFTQNNDTTIILNNNHKELTNTVLLKSKEFNEETFRNITQGNKFTEGKKYFIRFKLRYLEKDCNYEIIF